jgi:WD40 repeat protein
MSTSEPLCIPVDKYGPIFAVAFNPNGGQFASGSQDGITRIWDTNGDLVLEIKNVKSVVKMLAFSPDGDKLAIGLTKEGVKIYTIRGDLVCTLKQAYLLTAISFSPNGNHIAACYANKTSCIWDITTGEIVTRLKENYGVGISIAYSSDGEKIVTGASDCAVRIHNNEGELLEVIDGDTLHGHRQTVSAVAFSPYHDMIVSASHDGSVCIRDGTSGDKLHDINVSDMVFSVAFSPTNPNVVAFSSKFEDGGRVSIWDFNMKDKPLVLWTDQSAPMSIAFSPNGNEIVLGSKDRLCLISLVSQEDINSTLTLSAVANKSIAQHFDKEESKRASQSLGQGRIFSTILDFANGERVRGEKGQFAPSAYYNNYKFVKNKKSSSYGSVSSLKKSSSSTRSNSKKSLKKSSLKKSSGSKSSWSKSSRSKSSGHKSSRSVR